MNNNSDKYSASLNDLFRRLNSAKKLAQETGELKAEGEQSIPAPDTAAKQPEGQAETKVNPIKNEGASKADQPPAEDVKKCDESSCEDKEKAFANKAAALLERITNKAVDTKKVASDPSNSVLDGVKLNEQLLSKVASAMLTTEEGRRAIQHTIESDYGKQLQLATMQELKFAAEQLEEYEMLQGEMEYHLKTASDAIAQLPESERNEAIKTAKIHFDNLSKLDDMALKLAYAAGAEAAEAMNNGEPLPESNIEQDPILNLQLIGEVIDELVRSGTISPEQAEMISQAIISNAMADQNEELSQEEFANAIQQLQANPEVANALNVIQQHLQGISNDSANANQEIPEDVNSNLAATDQSQVADGSKTASVKKIKFAKKYAESINKDIQDENQKISEQDLLQAITDMSTAEDLSKEDADILKALLNQEIIEDEIDDSDDKDDEDNKDDEEDKDDSDDEDDKDDEDEIDDSDDKDEEDDKDDEDNNSTDEDVDDSDEITAEMLGNQAKALQ